MQRSLFLFLLLVACSSPRQTPSGHPAIHERYAADLLQEDFEQAVRVLGKNHPALNDFIDKDAYEKLIDQQSAKLENDLTLAGFYDVLLPVVTGIGCGHLSVYPPQWIWEDSTVTVFPSEMLTVNNRIYVGDGREIVSLNEVPTATILQSLRSYVSTDGKNASAAGHQINQSFNILAAFSLGFPEKYEVRYVEQSEQVSSIRISDFINKKTSRPSRLQFELDSLQGIAVVTIRSFGFYEPQQFEEFKKFVDDSFGKIKDAGLKNVILDVRGNRGGDPKCGGYLLSYLIDKPVKYFAKSYPGYEYLAEPTGPATNRFDGSLKILIDGGCFSTTGHFCALLEHHGIGEFIGSETGGTYTCNDGSQTFKLVNTGLEMRVPTNTFEVAVDGIERFKGITPDHIIEPTINDLTSGIDPVMTFARKNF